MGSAYTPGLLISPAAVLRKERSLPLEGEVLVSKGDRVRHDTIVARAERRGHLHILRAAQILDVEPDRVPAIVDLVEGDRVAAGQVVAEIRHLFGLMRSECRAPVDGVVESISAKTGHLTIREDPVVIELSAYVDGKVLDVQPGRGVTIETHAAVAQGIFGLGGERTGALRVVDADAAKPDRIGNDDRGRVIAFAGQVGIELLERARELGVAGVVAGSIGYDDLRPLLGEELGVAITGQETIGFTLVVTEGFGDIAMAARTLDLLRSLDGRVASINGTTQIRAGVIRPEIVIPRDDDAPASTTIDSFAVSQQLQPGASIRVIRAPWFGRLGIVEALPEQPVEIETGARVRVLDARLDSGETIRVPRSNVEVIA